VLNNKLYSQNNNSKIKKTLKKKPYLTKKIVNDSKKQKIISSTQCSTCNDAKFRSRSQSTENILLSKSDDKMNTSINSSNSSSSSPTWSSCSKKRGSSHSPICSRSCKPINPDSTYTMINSRSRSCDSILKQEDHDCRTFPFINLNPQSDILIQKLFETESNANRIASQLSFLKDFIKHEILSNDFDPMSIAHLEMERNRLLDQLDSFSMVFNELKAHLYEMNLNQVNGINCNEKNEMLLKQLESLEAENQVF
jgi:hypothetical protein